MSLSLYNFVAHYLCLGVLLAAAVSAQSTTVPTLILNQATEHEIKGGETQFYFVKKDKVWEVVALVEGGDILRQLGELQTSVEMTERGLSLARAIGNREHKGSALHNLGVEYKELGDYDKAIFYLTQAFDIQRETSDKRGEAIVLNNLGGGYLLRRDLEKAEEFHQRSIVLRRAVKDRRGIDSCARKSTEIAACRHRAYENSLLHPESRHTNAVAQYRTAGKRARRINANYPDPISRVLVVQGKLIHER